MRGRPWVVLLLVVGLGGLRTLADTSPPDPLWVPGVYDDADHDDVVGVIIGMDGLQDGVPPTLERPARVVARINGPAAARLTFAPRVVATPRAPPVSS